MSRWIYTVEVEVETTNGGASLSILTVDDMLDDVIAYSDIGRNRRNNDAGICANVVRVVSVKEVE